MAQETASCRSQSLLRARIRSCSPLSPFTSSPSYSFHQHQFSSATQSCPTLRSHESQHARPPCPSPTPGVHSNPCPTYWLAFPVVSPPLGRRLQEGKVCARGGIGPHTSSSWVSPQVFGFFKGMSFPLASIAVYNSVVFGVFSNTQRFLSHHRCREPEAGPPHVLSDLLLASMVAGVVSVGLGAPVDLIKIRLQMQTQPFQEGKRPGRWPCVWAPMTLSWLPSSGMWLISFLWSRASMSNHFY